MENFNGEFKRHLLSRTDELVRDTELIKAEPTSLQLDIESHQRQESQESFEKRDAISEELKRRRADRKDSRNSAYLEMVKDGSALQNRLATSVTRLTIAQVIVVNFGFVFLFSLRVWIEGTWPSDKLLLGWAASTVVEIIGLYAIVLKGVFPGGRALAWRTFKRGE